jgi:Ca2+-binding EF-hand superfamily protein
MSLHQKVITSIPYVLFVKLHQLFEEYSNKNRGGGITVDNFYEILNNLIPDTFTENEASILFKKCDSFDVGKITWNEFSSVYFFNI